MASDAPALASQADANLPQDWSGNSQRGDDADSAVSDLSLVSRAHPAPSLPLCRVAAAAFDAGAHARARVRATDAQADKLQFLGILAIQYPASPNRERADLSRLSRRTYAEPTRTTRFKCSVRANVCFFHST